LVVAVLGATAVGCARVPGIYVYEDAAAVREAAGEFDPAAYVDGIWPSEVQSTVQDGAVDAGVLLPEVMADPAAAGARYGRQAGTGSPFAYLVKGTGTVTAVDTAKPSGPVTVMIESLAGGLEVTLVTGPVIAGTALRDAIGIDFSQFENQLEYADVATQLNERVKSDVIAVLDREALVGKRITFAGAFAALSPRNVVVVPTAIEVAP
jgi:predicted lipoprotein